MRFLGLDISRSKPPQTPAEEPKLRDRVQRLEIALTELEEQHAALAGAHAKLRNHYHGSRGGAPGQGKLALASSDGIPVGDKAALRLYAGIKPGGKPGAFNRGE